MDRKDRPLLAILICLSLSIWLFIFSFDNSSYHHHFSITFQWIRHRQQPPPPPQPSDPCKGRYIYVHSLPTRFNLDMLHDCRSLLQWHDMCSSSNNLGLGPSLSTEDLISSSAWFNTNQFMLDLIFFHRMRRYPCLTNNSSRASAIYVPFFAGLDTGRYLFDSPNTSSSARDALALDLADWLVARPEWAAMGGRDHFLVCGRITWDFRRKAADAGGWGSRLFGLSAVKNMTRLLIERDTADDDEFGVPYPTYFHPSRDEEVFEWQGKLRVMERPQLYSFAGGPRPGMSALRDRIIERCERSDRCALMRCDSNSTGCYTPRRVMDMLERSVFCLQPPGDSFTRRSVFDSMLAGCIPVFFYTETAYAQYNWHLPGNHTSYSVFIPEAEVTEGKVDLEERLSGIGMEVVEAMREELIRMVPRLVYADPRGRLEVVEDAFDVAVKGVIERVEMLRREREKRNA
ncbi:hypothetical protein QJS10_CPB20g00728 [Acorus calamus]|uniref:Exostosin GT47 domain-containing protein n=1 Tax=Acorus calamus TaxID=4465 RepID=A0AAV9C818_ACOCL|nr:hypothetical protein QJS10_CPB20g00728 [Acorus calamus]